MKKIYILVALVAMLCLTVLAPMAALADGIAETADAGYTWAYLGTIAGATVVVLLIVQYTKTLIDKIVNFPTRLYVYILALGIMLAAKAATSGMGLSDIPLVALNAVVVATSAIGSYELTFAKKDNT